MIAKLVSRENAHVVFTTEKPFFVTPIFSAFQIAFRLVSTPNCISLNPALFECPPPAYVWRWLARLILAGAPSEFVASGELHFTPDGFLLRDVQLEGQGVLFDFGVSIEEGGTVGDATASTSHTRTCCSNGSSLRFVAHDAGPSPTEVDGEGCSLEQFCAGISADDRQGRQTCRRSDWKNNEPLRTRPRDCRVARDPELRSHFVCVAR